MSCSYCRRPLLACTTVRLSAWDNCWRLLQQACAAACSAVYSMLSCYGYLAALCCRTCQDALLKFTSAVGWGLLVQHDAKGMFPEVGSFAPACLFLFDQSVSTSYLAAAAAVAACCTEWHCSRWLTLLSVGKPRHAVSGTQMSQILLSTMLHAATYASVLLHNHTLRCVCDFVVLVHPMTTPPSSAADSPAANTCQHLQISPLSCVCVVRVSPL